MPPVPRYQFGKTELDEKEIQDAYTPPLRLRYPMPRSRMHVQAANSADLDTHISDSHPLKIGGITFSCDKPNCHYSTSNRGNFMQHQQHCNKQEKHRVLCKCGMFILPIDLPVNQKFSCSAQDTLSSYEYSQCGEAFKNCYTRALHESKHQQDEEIYGWATSMGIDTNDVTT